MLKRAISGLLALTITLSLLPTTVFADGGTVATIGAGTGDTLSGGGRVSLFCCSESGVLGIGDMVARHG